MLLSQGIHETSSATLWLGVERLVLASRSLARQKLLQAAGIDFESAPADIDERALEAALRGAAASPPAIAAALARAKAEAVSRTLSGRLILAADQVLAIDGTTYAKPADRAAAARQLAALSGRTHVLHSAAAVVQDGICLFETIAAAHMTMRELSASFIARYLDIVGEAACASVGAYQFEGLGAHLFAAVDGDHATIMGLPLLRLLAFLRRQGSLAA